MTGRSPSGPGSQAPPGAATASPPSVSIPNAVIEEFCNRVQPQIEEAVKRFCVDAYEAILSDVQYYLRENAVFNINSAFDAVVRDGHTAHQALAMIHTAKTWDEVKEHAAAAVGRYWSPERGAAIRAQGIEARSGGTAGLARNDESPVGGNADAPEPNRGGQDG